MPYDQLRMKRYKQLVSEFVKQNKEFSDSLLGTATPDRKYLKQQFENLTDLYEQLRQAYEDLME